MLSFFSKTFSEIRWVYEFYMLLDWHGSKNVSSLVRPAGLYERATMLLDHPLLVSSSMKRRQRSKRAKMLAVLESRVQL